MFTWHKIWEEETFIDRFIREHQIPTLDTEQIRNHKKQIQERNLEKHRELFQKEHPIWYFLYVNITRMSLLSVSLITLVVLGIFWVGIHGISSLLDGAVTAFTMILLLVFVWVAIKKDKYVFIKSTWWTKVDYIGMGDDFVKKHPFPRVDLSIFPCASHGGRCAAPLLVLKMEQFEGSSSRFLLLCSTEDVGDGYYVQYYIDYHVDTDVSVPVNKVAEVL